VSAAAAKRGSSESTTKLGGQPFCYPELEGQQDEPWEITMQLSVSGHHVEVTDSLRGYADSKIRKIARHFDLVSDVHCILTVEKLRHKAEATVHVNGNPIYADQTEEDMYAAIDGLADKLERRVRKYKEKLVDHHARDKQKIRYA
jgi:putative sigma-54 modulation protein